ncbi:diguanylate cyclase [Actinoplanes aureus]|uniref:GGDEF domain-containing protein n=1 Tax=Actinoplanes aureus TaxID=2792083 RepID=A0A931CB40_9ACTN|nr:diguanylate cyclase [Actinoplanes aureus]MBG0564707.1 GGDEF domain-containing protein [Actinoplanes aureus]
MRGFRVRLAAVIVAGVLLQLLLPLLGARTGVVLDNLVLALIALVTTVGHVRQTRQTRGRRRIAWGLAAAAAGLWVLSSLVDTADVFLVSETLVDEWLAVGAALCAPAALMLLGSAERLGRENSLRRLIDVATVTGALFFLAWEFVLAPAYASLPAEAGPLITLVLLPELIGAAYALVLLSRSLSHSGDQALSLLALSLMTFAATMLLAVHNDGAGLPWYATGVGAGYLVAGLLAALASHAPLPPQTFSEENHAEGRWALLPYVPVGLAFAASAWSYTSNGNVAPALFWLLLATAALVLVRQFLSLRTNQLLTRKLEYQATHDVLTGLVNRAAFQQRAAAVLGTACPQALTGVMLIDLDGFKAINDTLGHAAGDALLAGVAGHLRSSVRDGDTVARLGGDEFVILLPGLERASQAEEIGERIMRRLAEPIPIDGGAVVARASIGASVMTGPAPDPAPLVKQADLALYQAKDAGKGVVRCHWAGQLVG